jgi:hypothetical protein
MVDFLLDEADKAEESSSPAYFHSLKTFSSMLSIYIRIL